MSRVFRTHAKQRTRDQMAATLRQAHTRDRQLARALAKMWRTWERKCAVEEEREVALMDRCWWRREERAEALREASRENFTAKLEARRSHAQIQ